LVPSWLSQELAAAIPRARSVTIEACGHLPMIAAPQALVDAVLSFCL
jgi:pimeloyl-ACP methyl ester carboxylesterase